MGLVSYSDSESGSDHDEPVSKRPRLTLDNDSTLPPLPAEFHNLYSAAARVSQSDDPSLHGGRKRIVPHVQGNWAAHVYLEFHPSPSLLSLLTRLLTLLPETSSSSSAEPSPSKNVHSLLLSPTSVPLPLHISLSAPLVLRTETKDEFLHTLLAELDRLLSSLGTRSGTLTLSPTSLSWHPNQEKTRYFLVLRVGDAEEDAKALSKLLSCTNSVARGFGLSELYADRGGSHQARGGRTERGPSGGEYEGGSDGNKGKNVEDGKGRFHISIAWCLDAEAELGELGAEAKEVLEKVKKEKIRFEDVKVKMGKEVTSVPFLQQRKDVAKGGMLLR
ncbi:U6 snRNA phosphodiesterase Usb1 [Elsinoe ampelina]|uniref:U6 snRNA phosphodiesterase n=1 Tax=Elsinoe ampelina TaxID=302913 RepID=A0A6A6GGW3_9PEZI|nr:U6 snRNA phosphodiesterase Usb1 [Elsinoe ampelina]